MASHLDAILPAEVSDAICLFPSPDIGRRMKRTRLHGVLASHAVELLTDEVLLSRDTHISSAQRDAHEEILLENVLQTLCRYLKHYERQQKQTGNPFHRSTHY